MPSEAATHPLSPRTLPSRLLRWLRYAIAAVLVAACLLLLAVRYVVLPQLDSHRDDVAALLASELGHPVEIDGIATAWDGWNPKIDVRGLRVLEGDRAAVAPLIDLPAVSAVVSWTSLLVGEVRLRSLRVEGPRLAIRRDTSGRLHVAGIEFDPEATTADPAFAEWLLKQREIVVDHALVTWNDERRRAPQLLLDRVDLRLESAFGRHRFGLRGTPPPEVAAPIDVRGDFASLRDGGWKQANGRMYVRLDYADVAAWTEWLPLIIPVRSGEGALRLWFEIEDGVPNRVTADLELANVRTRLDDALPALDLAHLSGRVAVEHTGARYSITARDLSFVAPGGVKVVPADVAIRYELAEGGTTREGRISVSHLELGPLSALAAHLPLPERMREDISLYAPRGTVRDLSFEWSGALARPSTFRSHGTFLDLGLRAYEWTPGFSGLSGAFDVTDQAGSLRLSSREATLDMPRVFLEPIPLDTISGQVRWERRDERVTLRFEDIEFANADAAGEASGTWSSRPRGPGAIDLTARLARADARSVHRYLPRSVGMPTRVWLRDSIVAGVADEAALTLRGDLSRFPFAAGRDGTFLVTVRGREATVDYANGWPPLTGVDAEVRFEGDRLTVAASRGRVLGAAIVRAKATIPELSIQHPLLVVEGEASGPTAEFLRFVETSPVSAWIDRATDGMQAAGNARLGLRFEMHPSHPEYPARVGGEMQLVDNQLRMSGLPTLSRVNGRFAFSERELAARDVGFDAFGGSGRATISSRDGVTKVSGGGTANLSTLRNEIEGLPVDRVSGATDWRLDLSARAGNASWIVESSLRGAAVDLPRPLGKAAGDSVPFRLERRPAPGESGRESLIAQYGEGLRLVAERRVSGSQASVDRALVLLGKAAGRAAEPERAGVAIRGDVGSVDVDQWLRLMRAEERRSNVRAGRAPGLGAIDLEAGELIVLGRRFEQAKVTARRGPDGWRATIDSKPLEGSLAWTPSDERHANGRVQARFSRLSLAAAETVGSGAQGTAIEPAREDPGSNPWPELEVTAERYLGRSGDLGRMELSARPEGRDWRIDRFTLGNEAGRIDADGWWRVGGSASQTKLDVAVDVKDAGAFLARLGLPGDVKAAPTKIEGQIAWPGAPDEFAYPGLSGTLRVNVGAGQFTKLDPGVGRLLGVLSLQALPRRVTLDFRDVFSDGFAFDSIRGSVRIGSGVMQSDNLLVSGPAAKVSFSGDVDLERETQHLTVRVQPALSSTVSAGAGAAAVVLLAANPLVGAAVGAGTLLAQKILQDPIEQMFSYEYSVRGSWSEPVVERMAGRPVARAGDAATGAAGGK